MDVKQLQKRLFNYDAKNEYFVPNYVPQRKRFANTVNNKQLHFTNKNS